VHDLGKLTRLAEPRPSHDRLSEFMQSTGRKPNRDRAETQGEVASSMHSVRLCHELVEAVMVDESGTIEPVRFDVVFWQLSLVPRVTIDLAPFPHFLPPKQPAHSPLLLTPPCRPCKQSAP
jgi:hypothetical protein